MTDWRTLGPVHKAMWDRELFQAKSPLYAVKDEAYEAAGDHTALALAMMREESTYGTRFNRNVAGNRNLLNLRPPDGNGYLGFDGWVDGVRAWRERIIDPSYKGGVYARTRTIAELIHVYAPASDGNSERDYVAGIEASLLRWGVTPQEVQPMSETYTPTIYKLWEDYELFDLTRAEALQIMAKCFQNRIDGSIQGRPTHIMFHIQAGNTIGSLRYWLGKQASSTVMIQRNGSILQVIPEDDGPWTNGDDYAPKPAGQALVDQPGNSNIWTLSIEAEGATGDEVLKWPAQMAAIEWQARDWMKRYPETAKPGHQLEHADVQRIQKPNCAGAYYDEIMKRLAVPEKPQYATPLPITWKAGDLGWKKLGDVSVYCLEAEVEVVRATTPLAWADGDKSDGEKAPNAGPKIKQGERVKVIGSFANLNEKGQTVRWLVRASDNARIIGSSCRPLLPVKQ